MRTPPLDITNEVIQLTPHELENEESQLKFELQAESRSPQSVFRLGQIFLVQKKFSQTENLLSGFSCDDEHINVKVQFILLALYREQGRLAEAGQLLEKIREEYPSLPRFVIDYHQGIGFRFDRLWDKSMVVLEHTLAQTSTPENLSVLNQMGLTCFFQGNFNGAQHYFNQALNQDETYLEAHLGRIAAARDGHNWPKAEEYLHHFQKVCSDSLSWRYYLEEANCFRIKRKLNESLESLNKGLDLHPKSPEILLNIGHTFWEQKYVEKALEVLENAIAIDRGYVEPYFLCSTILAEQRRYAEADAVLQQLEALGYTSLHWRLLMQRGINCRIKRNFPESKRFFSQAAESLPRNPEIHQNQGLSYLEENLPNEAFTSFKAAIDTDPFYTEAYFSLSTAYNQLCYWQKSDGILDEYEQIAGDQLKWRKLMTLGIHRQQRGKNDESLTSLQEAAELNRNSDTIFHLSTAYQQKQDYTQAIDLLTESIQIDPYFFMGYFNLYLLYCQADKFTEAESIMDHLEGLEITFIRWRILLHKAQGMMMRGEYAESEILLKEAALLSHENPEILINLATIYYERKDFDKAITTFEQIIQSDPNYVEPYFGIVTIKRQLQQYKDAEDTLLALEALNKPPTKWRIHFEKSGIYQLIGKNESFRQEIDRSVSATSQCPVNLMQIGNFLETVSEHQEALRCYRLALEADITTEFH